MLLLTNGENSFVLIEKTIKQDVRVGWEVMWTVNLMMKLWWYKWVSRVIIQLYLMFVKLIITIKSKGPEEVNVQKVIKLSGWVAMSNLRTLNKEPVDWAVKNFIKTIFWLFSRILKDSRNFLFKEIFQRNKLYHKNRQWSL